MGAHCGARGRGTHLDQITYLVDDPETSPSNLAIDRAMPPDERIDDVPSVAYLTDQRSVLSPQSQRTAAAAMAHAVRCQLRGHERHIRGPIRQSCRSGVPGREPTHKGQIGGPEPVDLDTCRGFGKRLVEERCGPDAVELTTGMTLTRAVDAGVGDVGFIDHG